MGSDGMFRFAYRGDFFFQSVGIYLRRGIFRRKTYLYSRRGRRIVFRTVRRYIQTFQISVEITTLRQGFYILTYRRMRFIALQAR